MAARAASAGRGAWKRWLGAGVVVSGAGVAVAASEKDRRRALAVGEAGIRAARLVGTCTLIVADYKLERWRQSDRLSGNESASRRRVQDAENALEVADRTAKEAEQRLAQALGGGQVPGRTEREQLEREARRTMDVAAERAEDLVAARKEADRVSLSQGSIERVHQRSAERLLALARRNRGVYLKLAQHLSQLDYLLPDEYTDTLRVCLDDAPQSSLADVAATVAEELGRPIEELFLSFEPLPLASASLAQVHRATVRDAAGGARSVAVKVQHRGLRETATGDVDMVTAAVAVVSRIFPAMPFWWVADEIAPNLPVELDFRAEAANARRCAAMFRGDPRVAVPETLPALSSSRVLTMSFEPGCSVADRAAIERMGLAPARVASLISEAFCFQIFEQGFVHCDPHPANVLVRPDPVRGAPHAQLVLLDHGLYRQLSDDFRVAYAALWRALVFGDVEVIRRQCQRFNAGDMYPLLAAMLCARPWNAIVDARVDSLAIPDTSEERAKIKHYAAQYAVDIGAMLNRVPREMLLIFKANDCLRHLDRRLGSPGSAMAHTARSATRALAAHEAGGEDARGPVRRAWERCRVEAALLSWQLLKVLSGWRPLQALLERLAWSPPALAGG